jgi:hypothetical protein
MHKHEQPWVAVPQQRMARARSRGLARLASEPLTMVGAPSLQPNPLPKGPVLVFHGVGHAPNYGGGRGEGGNGFSGLAAARVDALALLVLGVRPAHHEESASPPHELARLAHQPQRRSNLSIPRPLVSAGARYGSGFEKKRSDETRPMAPSAREACPIGATLSSRDAPSWRVRTSS